MTTFLMTAWDWKPSVVLGCSGLLVAYAWVTGVRFTRQSLSWVAGVLLIFLALVSPADELADRYLFSAHMAKHILFVLVVPALLLAGMPAGFFHKLLRRRAVTAIEHTLGKPPVSWMAGIGMMGFWHIPIFFNAALSHTGLHILEHLSLLAAGTIYWWPILSPLPELRLRPVPHAASYLFTSCLACTSMGILITFAPHLLYPAYANPVDPYGILPVIREEWGISAATDQQIGGS